MSKSNSGGNSKAGGSSGDANKNATQDESKRRVVFSTDPEPVTPTPEVKLPTNPAAPLRARQLNTPVLVMLDRKGRGGKSVSVIKQVMSTPAGKDALLKLLKTKLGTGGTVKDGDIEIQGDHRDAILAVLKELGYQAKKAGG